MQKSPEKIDKDLLVDVDEENYELDSVSSQTSSDDPQSMIKALKNSKNKVNG